MPRGAPWCPTGGPRAQPPGNRHLRPRSRRGTTRCRRAPPGPGAGRRAPGVRPSTRRPGRGGAPRGQSGPQQPEIRPRGEALHGRVGRAVARSRRSPGPRSGQHASRCRRVSTSVTAVGLPGVGCRLALTAQPARRREVGPEAGRRRHQPVHHGCAEGSPPEVRASDRAMASPSAPCRRSGNRQNGCRNCVRAERRGGIPDRSGSDRGASTRCHFLSSERTARAPPLWSRRGGRNLGAAGRKNRCAIHPGGTRGRLPVWHR